MSKKRSFDLVEKELLTDSFEPKTEKEHNLLNVYCYMVENLEDRELANKITSHAAKRDINDEDWTALEEYLDFYMKDEFAVFCELLEEICDVFNWEKSKSRI